MFTYILKKLQLSLALSLSFSLPLFAMSGSPSDEVKWQYSQKAKIIKHLVDIVEWPSNAILDNRIHLCTIGSFPYDADIKKLNGNKVNGYQIAVANIADALKPNQNCQLLFIGKSETKNADKIIQAYAQKPVLLIADMTDFAEKGGNMNFIMLSANAVGLTINLESMEKSHLKIDMNEFQQYTIFPEEQEIHKLLQ